ncbi:vacuolar transporter chaperone [Podochytrium sp. JEL0797]|nr:vacuolar transporter chaperone [Podochytrium sp. JEL0797]
MKFGVRLLEQRKPEWEYYYINYELCKRFLKNTGTHLSELDEAAFVEILERELEKVASFRKMKGDELSRRVAKAERAFSVLQKQCPTINELTATPVLGASPEETQLAQLRVEVSSLLQDVGDLSKYTRLNYSGFMKILKKHDRYTQFQLKPMFLLKMRERPFYEETVDHLVVRLSRIFQNVRTGGKSGSGVDLSSAIPDKFVRRTKKYWVHYDKVDDVRNEILKKIPILIVKNKKGVVEDIPNPAISTVYFDNDGLELYNERMERKQGSQLVRMRWYGDNDASDIFVERKVLKINKNRSGHESSDEDNDDEDDESTAGTTPKEPRNLDNEQTEKSRFAVKEKFVNAWLSGKHQMDKTIQKMNEKVVLESVTSPAFSPSFSAASFAKSPMFAASLTSPSLVATTSRTAVPSKSRLEDLARLATDIQTTIRTQKLKPILRTFYNRTAFQIPGDLRVRISLDTELTFIREDNFGGVERSGDNWRRPDCGATWPFDYLPKDDVSSFPYAVLEVKVQTAEGASEPAWVKKLVKDALIVEVPMFSKYIHGTCDLLEDKVNMFPEWLPLLNKEHTGKARIQPSDMMVGAGSRRVSAVEEQSGLVTRRPSEATGGPAERVPLGTPDVVGFQAVDVTKRIVIPVRIEPKVYLANERTFLSWLHYVITLCGMGLGLINFGDKVGQIAGLMFNVVGFLFMGHALYLQKWRADMIFKRGNKPFDDLWGPTYLSIVLIVAVFINLYLVYGEEI